MKGSQQFGRQNMEMNSTEAVKLESKLQEGEEPLKAEG